MQPEPIRATGGFLIPLPAKYVYLRRHEWSSKPFSSMWLPSVIAWVPCFSDLNQQLNVTFECANLTVPVDYLATSGNSTTQIGMAKARPYGITQPSGIIFYQGSASATVYQSNSIGTLLNMTNREYDIILVDARGSGWSNPLTCGYTSETYQIADTAYKDAISNIDSVELPLSLECVTKIIAADSIFGVQNCTQNEDPQYLAHLNAPNIARDLDLIRNLSGFDTLSYYGEDYGSIIGITYANLFPNQVGHMVLDSVRDFEAWMGVNGNFLDYSFEMFSNVDDITHQFVNFCLAAYEIGSKYCPFAGPSINTQDPATDMVNRINAIYDYLSTNAEGIYSHTTEQWTFIGLSIALSSNLGDPFEAWNWAQIYLQLETAIQSLGSSNRTKRQASSTSNSSFAFFQPSILDPFLRGEFARIIIDCLDSNFVGINDPDSFSNYVLKEIKNNPLVAYHGLWWNSADLTCSNLSSYNPEKLSSKFSSRPRNPIIITAQTYNLGFPMSAAMNTYNFMGSGNAVFFVHDVYYYSPLFNGDVDDCTMNVIKAYFTEDKVPENGTVCHTDYSGMNNIFIKNYLGMVVPDNGKKKLEIGLGIGLGFTAFICFIILIGYWNLRRNRRQKIAYGGDDSKSSEIELTPVPEENER